MSGMPRHIVILSDGRPGHFRQSEAIALALGRKGPVTTERIELGARGKPWPRLARRLGAMSFLPIGRIMALAYRRWSLPEKRPDVIVSAGGDTLPANVALARAFGVPNIFSGSLRNARPQDFAAVLLPYESEAGLPNHIILPKPSSVDPDLMRAVRPIATYSATAPLTGALLLGGPSGSHGFSGEDWQALADFLCSEVAKRFEWVITNSPRTPDRVSDQTARFAETYDGAIRFVDYRAAGAGSVNDVIGAADFVLCTEDSSSMVVEAVCAQRPTVALQPSHRQMNASEEAMFNELKANGWLAALPMDGNLEKDVVPALSTLRPMQVNHLDRLGDELDAAIAKAAADRPAMSG